MKPALFAMALFGIACSAHAAYPERPIKLIVPYAAGGTTDIIARIVGTRLGPVLGQPVVIENRPGAGGAVGSAYAAKQPADGYTLVMEVESSHAVNPNVYLKTAFGWRLVLHHASPGSAGDVQELVTEAGILH